MLPAAQFLRHLVHRAVRLRRRVRRVARLRRLVHRVARLRHLVHRAARLRRLVRHGARLRHLPVRRRVCHRVDVTCLGLAACRRHRRVHLPARLLAKLARVRDNQLCALAVTTTALLTRAEPQCRPGDDPRRLRRCRRLARWLWHGASLRLAIETEIGVALDTAQTIARGVRPTTDRRLRDET